MPAADDEFDQLDDQRNLDDERFVGEDDLDDDEPDDGRGWAWPAGGYPPPPPSGLRRRPVVLIVTAVVAAAAGFGVVAAAMHDVTGSPATASATPDNGSSGTGSLGTGSPGGGQSLLPPQSGGGSIPTPGPGEKLQLQLGGRVTAVSAASITVGAGGQSVTAIVTRATKVSGKVSSIAGIKVGDMVSATITGTDGKLTTDTIQDPASMP